MDYFDPGEGYDFDFDAFNFELPDIDFSSMFDDDMLKYMYNPPEASSGTGLTFGNGATSLRDIFSTGEPGLKLPEAGNVDSMGGGQGLTIDTDRLGEINPFWNSLPDGIATQNGIYRPDWLPALGDPASFINDQSRPINGAGQLIGGTGSLATGNQNPVQQGQSSAAAAGKPLAQQIKDALNGNGGLNKAALAALAAYLLNKGDDKGSGGTFTAPNMNLKYQRGRVAQDPGRRPGAANPGGYFTPVTYAAQGGLMAPARRMATGGGIEGLLKGPGDGLSDDIPATIDGQDPAQLATGEFVVSADVVSALGGGDTDAGAKRLEEMMSRVRTQAHGTPKQTRPVSDKALPA